MKIETFLSPNLLIIGREIAQRTKDGWEIDELGDLVQLGWQYEVRFIKLDEEDKKLEQLKEEAFPKRKPGRPAKD